VCGSGILIAMSDAHVHHFRMRTEHARDCVTSGGWGYQEVMLRGGEGKID
jgi:hypothetical protein